MNEKTTAQIFADIEPHFGTIEHYADIANEAECAELPPLEAAFARFGNEMLTPAMTVLYHEWITLQRSEKK